MCVYYMFGEGAGALGGQKREFDSLARVTGSCEQPKIGAGS